MGNLSLRSDFSKAAVALSGLVPAAVVVTGGTIGGTGVPMSDTMASVAGHMVEVAHTLAASFAQAGSSADMATTAAWAAVALAPVATTFAISKAGEIAAHVVGDKVGQMFGKLKSAFTGGGMSRELAAQINSIEGMVHDRNKDAYFVQRAGSDKLESVSRDDYLAMRRVILRSNEAMLQTGGENILYQNGKITDRYSVSSPTPGRGFSDYEVVSRKLDGPGETRQSMREYVGEGGFDSSQAYA
ncbi:hypothetical protein [Thalassospira xiamenensis]|uniref:Uncharacterized protein n=1 Tax=Thalassospira xiamenensis TaxID=220697 RepID=A0A285THK4_9PROT|nr:hypothetical protein [Thalassospira xiamenensis]SOC21563.1 hypothetical protein SAMN05428964_103441 [Thalassospira xiamenensis]